MVLFASQLSVLATPLFMPCFLTIFFGMLRIAALSDFLITRLT